MLVYQTKPSSDNFDTDQSIKNTSILLSMAYAVVTLTLFTPVLSWILILATCACVIRIGFYFSWQVTSIETRTINLLAILAAIALAWFSISLGLLVTMVNLLVMACAFKLMRINSTKDIKQLFSSIVFLTACGLIFQQGIVFFVIYAVNILGLLTALLLFNSPSTRLGNAFRFVGIQSIQALPIAIVLLLVLPQLPPLWQMPVAKGTKTGLSDTVTPGDIAELSQSADLAFRGIFDSQLPNNSQRYWRVMTLEQFDGKTWAQSPTRRQINQQYKQLGNKFSPELQGDHWAYQIIAEASHQPWLFSLDIPSLQTQPEITIEVGHEYQLRAQRPVVSTLRYSVKSYYQQPLNQTLFSIDKRINLQLPDSGNPLTQQWVSKLREQYPNDLSFVNAIQNYFLNNAFSYTLRPAVMHTDPIDSFLFNQQAGFCAHYASALTYALRLGGIPARMVTGYQGGEVQISQVISVHQYDAHAWVEAWLDQRGWIRFDPTAWVAPDRIDYGLEQAMRDEGSFLADSPMSLARFQNIAAFNQLRLWFANIDYQWSKWVLGFNNKQQQDLLRKLFGELSTQKLSFIGIGVVLFIAALLGLYMFPQLRRPERDPIIQLYRQSAAIVSSVTGVKRESKSPNVYLQSIKPKLTNTSFELFEQITMQFVKAQYSDQNTPSTTEKKLLLSELKYDYRRLKKQLLKEPGYKDNAPLNNNIS